MNGLYRELAPVTDAAWEEIEGEARQTLKRHLAGRRLVDVSGPHGWTLPAVGTGRVELLGESPVEGSEARRRVVQPVIEVQVPFTLERSEIDAVTRGAKDADWDPVRTAARRAALAEDRAIFNGYGAGCILGIGEKTDHDSVPISDDYAAYPGVVATALGKLRAAGVAGPYAIALGPRCFTGLTETAVGGFPVIEHVRRLLDGPIVWAPAVDGAVVLSLRGGDFELVLGQDFSIGYLGHDAESVRLYIVESFTFRVLAGEAAVALRYTS
jgi:uncharacterized linocin/CFP29 family protein